MLIIGASDAGQTVELPVGQTMELRLEENPTTGFRWNVEASGRAGLHDHRRSLCPARLGIGQGRPAHLAVPGHPGRRLSGHAPLPAIMGESRGGPHLPAPRQGHEVGLPEPMASAWPLRPARTYGRVPGPGPVPDLVGTGRLTQAEGR